MKFILMMHAPRGTGDYNLNSWSPKEIRAHVDFMQQLNEELMAAGELVTAEGLTPPSEARMVRVGKDGAPLVTDGPFPETKEFLAGFWIVDVDSTERAYQIAARASSAPGPGGEPLRMAIELRPVGEAPNPSEE